MEPGLARRIYAGMLTQRVIDNRATALQRQGRVGFHVGAQGEEAAIIASAAALRPQDWIFPCYREWGAALFRGMPLQQYVDNLFANGHDAARGRQMPDHISARAHRFLSVSSPIGTQITQAVGFAWAARFKREDLVTAVYLGDGATSSNDFHAGMNHAAVFKAPTVFLLRNNGWAISTPAHMQTRSATYADKAVGYGMWGVRCDGNDAPAVYTTVAKAVARAAAGEGPTLVELVTYRAGPHSTSDDPSVYRSDADAPEEVRRCPLSRMRAYLEHLHAWSETEEAALIAQVERDLREAIERAEGAPPPPIASLFEDVYESMPAHLAEQAQACLAGPRARRGEAR